MTSLPPDDRRRAQFEHERKYHFLLLEEGDPQKRKALYNEAYGQLYAQFFSESSGVTEFGTMDYFVRMLRRWGEGRAVLDIGCGLGTATLQFAQYAREAIGLEVDGDVVARCQARFEEAGRPNARALAFDGTTIPLPDASIDLAYSNNVLEHLHPDDAEAQTREVFRVLSPGGRFVCITPPRRTGPHDISKFFLPKGHLPEGLHLKEYDLLEAVALMKGCGFSRCSQPWIKPDRMARWGILPLYPALQRSIGISAWLENSRLSHSGFLFGALCMDSICLCARKA